MSHAHARVRVQHSAHVTQYLSLGELNHAMLVRKQWRALIANDVPLWRDLYFFYANVFDSHNGENIWSVCRNAHTDSQFN
jgi:hypothetical protein